MCGKVTTFRNSPVFLWVFLVESVWRKNTQLLRPVILSLVTDADRLWAPWWYADELKHCDAKVLDAFVVSL